MIEIAKRDIWTPLAVARERPDAAFNLVAVDFLPPQVLGSLMQSVAAKLSHGVIRPLRSFVYHMSSTVAALRLLAQVGATTGRFAACASCNDLNSLCNFLYVPIVFISKGPVTCITTQG